MIVRPGTRLLALLRAPLAAAAILGAPILGSAHAQQPASTPRLIVLVSVDQFSSDLFQQYRSRFTGGLRRLLDGAVFPNGYQSHAATETCPGHSTLMTGDRPTRTGIIANEWYDAAGPRPGPIYCAEDERKGSFKDYQAADLHLRVPTLGERMKAADPNVRTVSVAGKDRAAIMMGGHRIDELWFWRDGKGFISYPGRSEPRAVIAANKAAAAEIARPAAALPEPDWCRAIDAPVAVGARTVGDGRFARAAGAEAAWKASPAFDAAVIDLAAALIGDMRLGHGKGIDVLTVGASATDYIGHTFGTEGAEMCVQMASLDRMLGRLFAALDATHTDYVLALTADHGGNDIPERERLRAVSMADRVAADLTPKAVGSAIAAQIGWTGEALLYGAVNGDVWVAHDVTGAQRRKVIALAAARYHAAPQVAAVFTAAEVAATPMPAGAPETWTLAERARASFDAARSGDLIVFLQPRVTAIPPNYPGAIATHGSPWDYDRRVPILFWRRGLRGFEQPLSIETVDIMPTLAALIGFSLAPDAVDGRCLDLDSGSSDTCGRLSR